MLKIGFLGGGNMARAIVAGLVSSGADPKHVTVMDRHPEKLAALREQFGITTQEKPGDWITALDVVVLAVKPQGLKECCEQVASLVSPETTVLSIAAAVRADVIADWLGTRRVVRCIPNTPAMVGKGFSGHFCRAAGNQDDRYRAQCVMQTVGALDGESEGDLHLVTAGPGSGPAYVSFSWKPWPMPDAGGALARKGPRNLHSARWKVLRRWLVRAAKRLTCFVTTSRARAARPPRQSKRLRRTTCAVQSRRRCRLAEPAAKK